MLKIKNYFIFIIFVLIIYPFIAVAQSNINTEQDQTVVKQNVKNSVSEEGELLHPVLAITPQEINLGTITPGEAGRGIFTLKNTGSGVIDWSTDGPEGWEKLENQKLSSAVKSNALILLRVEVQLLSGKSLLNDNNSPNVFHTVEMKLEAGGKKLICHKEFSIGTHKEDN